MLKGCERHTTNPKSAVMERAKEIMLNLYSKQYPKSYVTCEKPSTDFPGWTGQRLELVPVREIPELKAGEDLELKVYFRGAGMCGIP